MYDTKTNKLANCHIKLFKSILMLICFFFFNPINAQEYIGTNEKRKRQIQEVEQLIDSAYQKIYEVNWDECANFSKRAFQKSKQYKYNKGVAWSSFYLGQAFFEQSKYKEALHYINSSEDLEYTQTDYFLRFEIHRVRCRLYGNISFFKKAIQEQKRGLQLIPYIQKSKSEKDFLTSLAYSNLANTYKANQQHDSMFYFQNKNKILLENMDESFVFPNLINLYSDLAAYHSENENYTGAEKYFRKSLSLSRKYNYQYLSYNYIKWGDMEVKRKKNYEALQYYMLALENIKKSGRRSELADVYMRLSTVYDIKGDKEKAKEYQLKSLYLKSQIRDQQIESSELVLEKLEKEKDIESSNRDSRYLIGGGAIFLIILLVFMIYRYKNKQSIERLKITNNKQSEVIYKQKNEAIPELIILAKENNIEFWPRFQEVYPNFSTKLLQINPELKSSELAYCAYIYLGFNTKEIADYTFKSIGTIKNYRSYIRKSLGLTLEENFKTWLQTYINQ